jgi:hypothetical protein
VALLFYLHLLEPAKFEADTKPSYGKWKDECAFTLFPDGADRAGASRCFIVKDPNPVSWNFHVTSETEPFNPWNLKLEDDFSSAVFDPSLRPARPNAPAREANPNLRPVVVCPRCKTGVPDASFQSVKAGVPAACPSCKKPLRDLLFPPKFSVDFASALRRNRALWARILAGSIPAGLRNYHALPPSPSLTPGSDEKSKLPSYAETVVTAGMPTTVAGLVARYLRFMALKAAAANPYESSSRSAAVLPTPDIDLVWGAHQLSPRTYQNWSRRYFGTPPGGQGDGQGASAAALPMQPMDDAARVWRETYGLDYSNGCGWLDLGGMKAPETLPGPSEMALPHVKLYIVEERVETVTQIGLLIVEPQEVRRAVPVELRDLVAANYWLRYPRQSWYSCQTLKRRYERRPTDEEALDILLERKKASETHWNSLVKKTERRKVLSAYSMMKMTMATKRTTEINHIFFVSDVWGSAEIELPDSGFEDAEEHTKE